MAESIKHATQFIEQGHIRLGSELIKDPAFLVSRYLFHFLKFVCCKNQLYKYLSISHFVLRKGKIKAPFILTVKRNAAKIPNA